MVTRYVEFYYKRLTDWLAVSVWLGYVILLILRMFTNKTLINDVEAYFLPSNRASNITAMKAKVLSQNSWYKRVAYVLENYSQIRSKLSMLLSENKLYWIDWKIF